MADTDTDIEIFRTGRFQSIDGRTLSFGDGDLAGTAECYDPALHEAPAVVGHPKLDAPAYGWVQAVHHQGDRLVASFRDFDPAFAELVRAGRYRKVSAAFYDPDDASNPVPGTYYLRHVGFLGATPPAVKGLKQAQFAAGDNFIAFAEATPSIPARLLHSIRALVRAEIARTEPISPDQEDHLMTNSTAFAERERQLNAEAAALRNREAALTQREQGIAQKETAFSEQERTRFATANRLILDGLEKDGRSLPAWRPALLAMMGRMQGAPAIAFGEGDDKLDVPMIEAFQELLGRMPKIVEFAEIARAPVERAAVAVTRFVAPKGYTADADDLALRDRALAYAEQHKIDFVEAVRRLEAQSA